MKKICMALMLCLVSIVCFGEHQVFKGVSMGETGTSFIKQLTTSGGLKLTKEEDITNCHIYSLSGSFAGYDNCEIFVYALPDLSAVFKAVVFLPEQTGWYSLKSQFNKLKDAYINKYGTYKRYYHDFDEPYYEGDGYEMSAVRLEKCNYFVYWEFEYGSVGITISKYKQVKITYEDSENFNILEKLKNQSMNNDI